MTDRPFLSTSAYVIMPTATTSHAHTPGPWHAELVDLLVYVEDGGERRNIAAVINQKEPTDDSDVTSANARLIAAAPALLDCCRMLLAITRRDCDAEELRSEISHAEGVVAHATAA